MLLFYFSQYLYFLSIFLHHKILEKFFLILFEYWFFILKLFEKLCKFFFLFICMLYFFLFLFPFRLKLLFQKLMPFCFASHLKIPFLFFSLQFFLLSEILLFFLMFSLLLLNSLHFADELLSFFCPGVVLSIEI